MRASGGIANAVVVQGHSGYLFVPALFIPLATYVAFAHYRDSLPEFCIENAEKVIGLAALVTLALAAAALFLRSRRVELHGDRLRYRSWVTDRTVAVAEITAVTLETELSGGAESHMVEHFLTLWSGDDARLRFNIARWPRDGLQDLLRALQARHPALRLDVAVERYISGGRSVARA